MKQYDIVVFDVDGTLLDTTEGVISAVKYTITKNHLPELSDKQLRSFIGPPIQNSFQKFYGIYGDELQRLAECFRNQYKEKDLLKAVPYKGIYEVLQKLNDNGIKLAIATYKREDYALTLLKHFEFDKYTSVIYGADNFNKLKKKDIIVKCMNDLGVYDYEKAVMVGDSDNDAVGAKDIGMKFLGVTYGFGFSESNDVFQYPAIGCAAEPKDILKFIIKRDC